MPNLILIPTDRERSVIEAELQPDRAGWELHTIGFGVVASAVNAARLIFQSRPEWVVVAGIAGKFDRPANRDLALGEAVWFSDVRLDGIGVGQAERFIDAAELGWPSPLGDPRSGAINLWTPDNGGDRTLITVCSGSSCSAEATWRGQRFPAALGEDMESYGVAAACRAAGVRCGVLRGLSNEAGCRDHGRWKTDAALISVADRLRDFFNQLNE